jgi:hypothetical protein
MLKVEIPTKAPSIWVRIANLRINSLDSLAPIMRARTEDYLEDAVRIKTVNGEIFDPIVFETARVDELQQIYFDQGTTKAATAIYGWHFYGLAIDVISKSKEWSVKTSWWRANAALMRAHGIDPGFDWNNPDEPHGQFGTLRKSPSDLARTLYFGTAHWQGMKTFAPDDPRHMRGLRRVWKAVGAM